MNDDLNGYLDGERDAALTDEALRREAQAWDRLVQNLRREVPGPAPAWLETRVMAEVRALEAGTRRGRLSWLLRPRMLRVSPLGMGLTAATVLALVVGTWLVRGGVGPPGPAGAVAAADGPREPLVYVQFVLEAPGASSVAVSGDFNEWDRTVHRLEDPDGDGVWTGRVPVRPGIHEYMFVVDGERWVTDPRAERYADDGFGNRNAVLAVAGADRT